MLNLFITLTCMLATSTHARKRKHARNIRPRGSKP